MKILLLVITLSSVISLNACTTFDPYTGEEKTTNTAKGAGIGAGAALVLSYLANKDKSSSERNKRMI